MADCDESGDARAADVVRYLRQTRSQGEFERSPLISLKNEYMFFPVSKAANSSLKSLLFRCELAYSRIAPPKDNGVHRALCSPLVLPYQLEDLHLGRILTSSSFKKLTLVRNPYDRALSCYLDRIQKPHTQPHKKIAAKLGSSDISFRDFLAVAASQDFVEMDIHYRPQVVELGAHHIDFDLVGRFEELEDSAKQILEAAFPGMDAEDIGFQSPTATEAALKSGEYYGPDERELASRLYEEDFRAFDYGV